jgi:tetratricopeptide (TPR) repeat protein/predicted Ser/Thr protein kinase
MFQQKYHVQRRGGTMIGETISHYRILEKLGAGGMGVVYKAQDTRLDRAVALKFLPDNLAHDALALQRFRREVHAASALNHAGICTIYEADEQDGRPFIVMEFIDGETLSSYIHGKPLAVEQILTLGIQIADALSVAHGEGIIHRDIKPANIYITKRGQAKVLDFGLAKLSLKSGVVGEEYDVTSSSAQEAMSIVGVISGTPSYMSPEQIRGDDLDARTDVFSLGLLLYEMATGRQAFSGSTGGAVIEAILMRTPTAVRSLNAEVPEALEGIISKALNKDVRQRYQNAAEVCADLRAVKRVLDSGQTVTSWILPPRTGDGATPVAASATTSATAAANARPESAGRNYKWMAIGLAGALVLAIGAVGWLYNIRQTHALSETDTIVVADFINKTGDAVFDDALRQGLAAQLQQSPFLNLLSEQKIQQTLLLMGKRADTKLTPEIARDVCTRAGSKAYLSGSISNLGSQYVIGVNAVNCQTGDSLGRQQVTADNKEGVLKALDTATTKLRETLGESLKTIQKLDTPIEQATTPSLEALQAYSLGRKMMLGAGDYSAAVPLLQHAAALDPKFAMAYGLLGTCYSNLGEKNLAAENAEKSYLLRGHVSEWEKFYIESHYYHFVTGDLEKARQAYESWSQTYPRESVAPGNLGVIYQTLGQYEKSLTQIREAIRLSPGVAVNYANLVDTLTRLNRFGDAREAAKDAWVKKLDSPDLHFYLYNLDFLQKDAEGMAKQMAWSAGKPGKENILFYLAAEVAGYGGQLGKAREFSREAVTSAERAEQREIAARCAAAAALREATLGNFAEAKRGAAATLALSNGRDAQYIAALAVAMAGDSVQAQISAEDLAKRFPQDTIVQFNYLPTLRAQIALNHSSSGATNGASIAAAGGVKAVEALQAAAPYESGVPGNSTFAMGMYPVYVRGMAYLDAKQGGLAAAEFQKIVDRPGVVVSEPIGALAYLGLGRAFAMSGDVAKAKRGYEEFFKLWKDADGDVPVLKAAKAEYGKLG